MSDHQMSVLLIDDDVDTRNLFEMVMQHYNIQLEVRADAASAFTYLETHSPDIVVLDIFLPGGIDGYKALQHIRKNGLAPECQVIATTAYYTSDTQKEVLAWGFSGYLPKPLNPTKLVSYFEQVMAAH